MGGVGPRFLPVALSRPGPILTSVLKPKGGSGLFTWEQKKTQNWKLNGRTLCKSLQGTVKVYSLSLPTQPPGPGSEGLTSQS